MSCETQALTLHQVELHPAVNAPPLSKTLISAYAFAKSLLPATGKIF
jgi:hypothetical protein